MAIRPIHGTNDVEVVEEPGLWQRHGARIIFLGMVMVLGVYFFAVWQNLGPTDARYVEFEEPVIDEAGTPQPTRAYRFFASEEELQEQFLSPEETWEELQVETQRLFGVSVSSAGAQVEDLGNAVLGEATTYAEQKASESAEAVTTTIYRNTIGQVIMQLFQQLPDPAREAVIEDITTSEGENRGEAEQDEGDASGDTTGEE